VKRSLLTRGPSTYISRRGRQHTVLRLCGEWFVAFLWMLQVGCLLPGGRMVTFGAVVRGEPSSPGRQCEALLRSLRLT